MTTIHTGDATGGHTGVAPRDKQFLPAVGIAAAYLLSNEDPAWLWAASALLSIHTYLETYAFGVFTLGYGRIGPTEVRLALLVLNTLIALASGSASRSAAWG